MLGTVLLCSHIGLYRVLLEHNPIYPLQSTNFGVQTAGVVGERGVTQKEAVPEVRSSCTLELVHTCLSMPDHVKYYYLCLNVSTN